MNNITHDGFEVRAGYVAQDIINTVTRSCHKNAYVAAAGQRRPDLLDGSLLALYRGHVSRRKFEQRFEMRENFGRGLSGCYVYFSSRVIII